MSRRRRNDESLTSVELDAEINYLTRQIQDQAFRRESESYGVDPSAGDSDSMEPDLDERALIDRLANLLRERRTRSSRIRRSASKAE